MNYKFSIIQIYRLKESINIYGKHIAELDNELIVITKESLLIIPKESILATEPDLYPEELNENLIVQSLPPGLQNWIQKFRHDFNQQGIESK